MKIYSNTITKKRVPTNQERYRFAGTHNFSLNDKNPSFKGMPTVKAAVAQFGEDFGKAAGEYFNEIIKKAEGFGLEIDTVNDTIIFDKDQSIPKKVLEMITYPVAGLPLDLTNGVISGLKKIPFLEKKFNGLSDKHPFFKMLQKRKDAVGNKSNVAAIKHYFELVAENGGEEGYLKRFLTGHTRLKPNMPNYSSQTERPLNRVVTGLIPAFFLANDAFNLSMYMKNDKEAAAKEKKRRFNQEVARIAITATATFYLLSMFAKKSNNSIGFNAATTAGLVLVSEASRQINSRKSYFACKC